MAQASTTTAVFPTLLAGLESFRNRVAGSEGDYRQALLVSGQSTLVLDISGSMLRVVRGLLRWLRDAIVMLEQRLVSIDALIAIGEVTVVLLAELGGSLSASVPGLDSMDDVAESLKSLAAAAEALPDSSLLPGPELVLELRSVLEQLVGAPASDGSGGALDQLLQQIEGLVA